MSAFHFLFTLCQKVYSGGASKSVVRQAEVECISFTVALTVKLHNSLMLLIIGLRPLM